MVLAEASVKPYASHLYLNSDKHTNTTMINFLQTRYFSQCQPTVFWSNKWVTKK